MKIKRRKLHNFNCDLKDTITGTEFNINIVAVSEKELLNFVKQKYFHTELMRYPKLQ